jgi:hypothetical protein
MQPTVLHMCHYMQPTVLHMCHYMQPTVLHMYYTVSKLSPRPSAVLHMCTFIVIYCLWVSCVINYYMYCEFNVIYCLWASGVIYYPWVLCGAN